MSKELEQYLDELDIHMIRLVDGSTILAKIVDEDDKMFLLQYPHEVCLHEATNALDMSIHDWMFLSDDSEVMIQKSNVLCHSQANILTKNFYSKVVLRNRIKSMFTKENTSFGSKFIDSIIDGLDNKGFSNKYKGWDGYPKPWPPEEDI